MRSAPGSWIYGFIRNALNDKEDSHFMDFLVRDGFVSTTESQGSHNAFYRIIIAIAFVYTENR